VKESDLRRLLGDDWIRQQALAVRSHADSYIQITWGRLAATLSAVVKPNEAPEPLKRSTVKVCPSAMQSTAEEGPLAAEQPGYARYQATVSCMHRIHGAVCPGSK